MSISQRESIWYVLIKRLIWLCFRLVGRLQIVGAAQVPRAGGAMLASNHTSYADPPLVAISAPRRTWFMAKSELFRNPLFGALIRALYAFPVRRGVVDRQALRRAQELLEGGELVAIFIEGGTSPDGRLQPPSLGPAMIALRAGAPIVPVASINADHLLPLKAVKLHFARVTVVYGAPLSFPHLAGQAGNRAAVREVAYTVARAIAEMLRAHGGADRVPPGYLAEEGTQDGG